MMLRSTRSEGRSAVPGSRSDGSVSLSARRRCLSWSNDRLCRRRLCGRVPCPSKDVPDQCHHPGRQHADHQYTLGPRAHSRRDYAGSRWNVVDRTGDPFLSDCCPRQLQSNTWTTRGSSFREQTETAVRRSNPSPSSPPPPSAYTENATFTDLGGSSRTAVRVRPRWLDVHRRLRVRASAGVSVSAQRVIARSGTSTPTTLSSRSSLRPGWRNYTRTSHAKRGANGRSATS